MNTFNSYLATSFGLQMSQESMLVPDNATRFQPSIHGVL